MLKTFASMHDRMQAPQQAGKAFQEKSQPAAQSAASTATSSPAAKRPGELQPEAGKTEGTAKLKKSGATMPSIPSLAQQQVGVCV